MSNDTRLSPAVGATGRLMATEELTTRNGGAAATGVHVQIVKLGVGAEGDLSDVDASNPIPVSVVSAATLPADAATETKQDEQITVLDAIGSVLDSILTALASQATAALQSAANTLLSAIDTKLGTGNASLASIVTALGSQATAALQGTGNASLASIDAKLTNPLPVSGTVTANAGTNLNTSALALESGGNLATCATQTTNCATSLSVLDDWDESDRAKVNPIVGQAGVAAGAGAVGATVQRMTLASDDPAVASLSVIDDWDSNDRAKTSPIAGQDGIAGGSGNVSALTTRVVLATDVGLPAGTNLIGYTQYPAITTFTASNVASSASNVTLLAANSSRKHISIVNDSTATLYIKKGATASLTDYWVRLDPLDQLSCWVDECGTGRLDGIWSAANGNARIVEDT